MYDPARDCFPEKLPEQLPEQQEEQHVEEPEHQQQLAEAAPHDSTPRRRISTVGDLLSPVEPAEPAEPAEDTHDAPKESTTQSGSPGVSSATLSPDDTLRQKTADTPKAVVSPVGVKKREIAPLGSPEGRRKRPAPEPRDRDREREHDHERDRDRDRDRNRNRERERERERERDRDRDRDRDHRDRDDGKRRRVGGPGGSSGERSIYAPRRRSRSPQSYTRPYQRRPVSPGGRYRYRSPPPPALVPKRDPSPTVPPPLESTTRSRELSPVPPRKRPGNASRIPESEKAAMREKALRSELEAEREAQEIIKSRGVVEVVRAHYNDKQELGKEWRKTDSRIKGLRSFNNWVKSTIIQKFSPNDGFDPRNPPFHGDQDSRIRVLDMGCGKGGDLLKWKCAPQDVELYVGVDTADVSIYHARERYDSMLRETRRRRGGGRRDKPIFDAEFHVMDCWSNWVGDIPIVNRIGADPNVGPGTAGRISARWGGGGFDVVTMMFCMHYAFESESRCRTMLRNVAGSLKKGGRFIGTIPSSDIISARVQGKHLDEEAKKELDKGEHGVREWGNGIYRVRFAEEPPRSGTFRPPWGWRYSFFLEEAVEEVPEYVVPWEAFRAIAEDYNLELVYKKPFHDIWKEEKDDRDLKVLSERMGVTDRSGKFLLGDEEWEGCGMLFYSYVCCVRRKKLIWFVIIGFYLGFAFKKT